MTNDDNQRLIPIWEQHRDRILSYGHALHVLLPEGDPPVTLQGRDLRPSDEGVGFQFQFTLSGNYYNGDVRTACVVVQIELIERKTSIAVKVDAVPLLEYTDGHYELFSRRGTTLPIGDTHALRQFFARSLMQTAQHFFSRVRDDQPIDEVIAGIAEPPQRYR